MVGFCNLIERMSGFMYRKFMAYTIALALVICGITFTPNKTTKVSAAADPSASGWQLQWSDEFNGSSLDTNVWGYEIGRGDNGWGNAELQYYTARTSNVNVTGGNLQITAKKESYNDMLNNLEVILSTLENDELSLEDAMKEYEKGSKIVNKLYKTLDALEGKFLTIKENAEVGRHVLVNKYESFQLLKKTLIFLSNFFCTYYMLKALT